MLDEANTPPYFWNRDVNEKRYKLIAKKVFALDLLHHVDDSGATGDEKSGLHDMQDGSRTIDGLRIGWGIKF